MGTKRSFLVLILSVFCLLCADSAWPRTRKECIEQAHQLMDRQQFRKALRILRKGHGDYPRDNDILFSIAECHKNLEDYQTAIVDYLNLLQDVGIRESEFLVKLHHGLLDSYSKIGQQHYFSPELCLRIIYHTERIFEIWPYMSGDREFMEFLNTSIGHYDLASGDDGRLIMLEIGGDGLPFDLPADDIANEEKLTYLAKARRRAVDFNSRRREALYPTGPSDRSVNDIAYIIEQKTRQIKFLHARKTAFGRLIEEIFYEYPDKYKVIEPYKIGLLNQSIYYMIDKDSKKIVDSTGLNIADMDIFKPILLPNLDMISKYYDFTIEQFKDTPDFLADFYNQGFRNDLYLLTAKLKDKAECPFYPPLTKIEYFIDAGLAMAVAVRNYCRGTLGSGKEYELASETLIISLDWSGDKGLIFPRFGKTTNYISGSADSDEEWYIDIVSINRPFLIDEFDPEKFR